MSHATRQTSLRPPAPATPGPEARIEHTGLGILISCHGSKPGISCVIVATCGCYLAAASCRCMRMACHTLFPAPSRLPMKCCRAGSPQPMPWSSTSSSRSARNRRFVVRRVCTLPPPPSPSAAAPDTTADALSVWQLGALVARTEGDWHLSTMCRAPPPPPPFWQRTNSMPLTPHTTPVPTARQQDDACRQHAVMSCDRQGYSCQVKVGLRHLAHGEQAPAQSRTCPTLSPCIKTGCHSSRLPATLTVRGRGPPFVTCTATQGAAVHCGVEVVLGGASLTSSGCSPTVWFADAPQPESVCFSYEVPIPHVQGLAPPPAPKPPTSRNRAGPEKFSGACHGQFASRPCLGRALGW